MFGSGGGEKVASEMHVPFLGRLPMDAAVSAAGDRGIPLLVGESDGAAYEAFNDLTGKIAAAAAVRGK